MIDTTSYDITHAIIALDPDTSVSVVGEEQINWGEHGNPLNITADQIKAKQAELKASYDAKEYFRNRQSEYLNVIPIGDQLDAILKYVNVLRLGGQDLPQDLDDVVGKWLAVKQKYPK